MKHVFSAACLALAFTVGAGAQTPDPKGQGMQKSAAAQARNVTVTGCLTAGDQPDTFVLTNVKWEDQMKHEAAAKTGEKAKTGKEAVPEHDPAEMQQASLRLIGAPSSLNMKEHVGHTVTLTGMLNPQAKGTKGDPTGTAGKETAGIKERPVHSLNVKTMKHLSDTCK